MASVSQAELRRRVLDAMEDETRITPKQARDFEESLRAVCEQAVEDGEKLMVFGIVNITPSGVLAKPKRKGTDRLTGEEKMLDAVPAKIRVRATVGKRLKDQLPDPKSKVGKQLLSEAKARSEAAAERAAKREAEAEKAARKEARAAKAGTKAKGKRK